MLSRLHYTFRFLSTYHKYFCCCLAGVTSQHNNTLPVILATTCVMVAAKTDRHDAHFEDQTVMDFTGYEKPGNFLDKDNDDLLYKMDILSSEIYSNHNLQNTAYGAQFHASTRTVHKLIICRNIIIFKLMHAQPGDTVL